MEANRAVGTGANVLCVMDLIDFIESIQWQKKSILQKFN